MPPVLTWTEFDSIETTSPTFSPWESQTSQPGWIPWISGMFMDNLPVRLSVSHARTGGCDSAVSTRLSDALHRPCVVLVEAFEDSAKEVDPVAPCETEMKHVGCSPPGQCHQLVAGLGGQQVLQPVRPRDPRQGGQPPLDTRQPLPQGSHADRG